MATSSIDEDDSLGLHLQSENPIHLVIEKMFFKVNCDLCEKSFALKKGVKCQVCHKIFHKKCFQKIPDVCCANQEGSVTDSTNTDIFWQGFLAYSKDFDTKIYVNYWQLTRDSIKIYKAFDFGKQLHDIPLSKIKKVTNDAVVKTAYRNLFPYEAKVHFLTETTHLHCGLNIVKHLVHSASSFYNTFNLVYLPYNKKGRKSFKITAPKYEERKIEEDIVFMDFIGSGGFGKVIGGVHRSTDERVAIKTIDKSNFDFMSPCDTTYQSEVAILCNLSHPGIVKLISLYNEDAYLHIVMERLEQNLLNMILQRDPKKLSVTKFIAFQIFVALDFLHKIPIGHCDLKPENIMIVKKVDYPQVKLCDFGYSKIISMDSFRKSVIGTPQYNPPEIREQRIYNKQVDIWAMGVIIYVCLTGKFPFDKKRPLIDQIQYTNSHQWMQISENVKDLIKNELLQVSISRRACISRIFKHEWFNEDDVLIEKLHELESDVGQDCWLVSHLKQEDKGGN